MGNVVKFNGKENKGARKYLDGWSDLVKKHGNKQFSNNASERWSFTRALMRPPSVKQLTLPANFIILGNCIMDFHYRHMFLIKYSHKIVFYND